MSAQTPAPVPAPDLPGPDHRAQPAGRVIGPAQLRLLLYVAGAILAGLVLFGVLTVEQLQHWATTTIAVVALLTNLLAALNARN